jgi:hypothetical protein
MPATLAIRGQGEPLGRWVVGPFVGLVVLYLLATGLPTYSCDDSRGLGSSTLGVAFEIVGLGGAALLLGLAVWRTVRLRRRREPRPRRRIDRRFVVVLLLALAAFVYFALGNSALASASAVGAFFFCALLTLFAFLALAVAALGQRDAEEVGMLLPIYLAGAGLFVYLPVVAFVGAIVGGCWGE